MFVERKRNFIDHSRRKLLTLLALAIIAPIFVSASQAGTLKVFYPATHTGWVLQTPSGKVYVIDPGVAGEFYKSGPGGQGVGTYLKAQGIKTIHGMVISHPHPDHFSAGAAMFRDFTVKELVDAGFDPKNNGNGGYNAAFWKAFQASGATHRTGLSAGTKLDWDNELTVKVCGPKKPFWTFAEAGNDPERHYNQNSLVVWVKHGNVSHLFTGDITAPAQNYLRNNWAAEVNDTSILAVPHHGKYYYHDDFAKSVGLHHPVRLAIASRSHTGKGPRPDTVPHWRKAGLTVYTGSGNNDITVTSSGGSEFTLTTSNPKTSKTFSVISKPTVPSPGKASVPATTRR